MRATSLSPLSATLMSRCSLAFLLAFSSQPAAAIRLGLVPDVPRCVSEDMPAKTLLHGDWELGPPASHDDLVNATSVIEITAPDGSSLFKKTESSGHFAITATHQGLHKVCVTNHNATGPRSCSLNLKTALEVEDHQGIAKKEHVEAIEAELDRMKKMAVHVYEEMLYMRTRSDQQHQTNASTRGRLLWVEVVMMLFVLLFL